MGLPSWLSKTWEVRELFTRLRTAARPLLDGFWSVIKPLLLTLVSLGVIPVYFQFFAAFDPTLDVGNFRWRRNPSDGTAVLVVPVRFTNLGAKTGSITDVVARVKIRGANDDRTVNLLLSPIAILRDDYAVNRVSQNLADSMDSVFSPINLTKQETTDRLLYLAAFQSTAKLPHKELIAGEWVTDVLYRGEGFGVMGWRTTLDWQSAATVTGSFDDRDIDQLRAKGEVIQLRWVDRERLEPIP